MTHSIRLLLGTLLLSAAAPRATAAVIVYNTLSTTGNSGILAKLASPPGTPPTTNFLADDITVAPGHGGAALSSATFRAHSFNDNAVAVQPVFGFWAADGVGGAAGTLLGSFNLPVTSLAGNANTDLTLNLTPGQVTIPTNGQFWFGARFVASGSTTGDDLMLLGGQFFGSPTPGSSQDSVLASGPPGSPPTDPVQYSKPQPGPLAPNNLGLQFAADQASPIPEPATLAAFVLVGACGFAARRRTART